MALNVKIGQANSTGQFSALTVDTTSNINQPTTLANGAVTLAITKNFITLTGDGAGNTLATITGGVVGQTLTILFVDALVTITDTDGHGASTIDLVGTATDFVSADDTTLVLLFDGTSWYELTRSIN